MSIVSMMGSIENTNRIETHTRIPQSHVLARARADEGVWNCGMILVEGFDIDQNSLRINRIHNRGNSSGRGIGWVLNIDYKQIHLGRDEFLSLVA